MAKGNQAAAQQDKSNPTNSAKPGTKDEKAKKEKKVREQYPIPEGGLKAWPTDFDPKKHKPLKRKDFGDESLFLNSKADDYERRAKALREEALESTKLGGVKDKAKAKKLLSMHKKIAEMTKDMEADGVDVSQLLASLKMAEEAKEEAAG